MRINELARKYNLSNREIIDFLTRIGVAGKSHSSSLEEDLIQRVLSHFKVKSEAEAEAQPQSKFKRMKRVRPRPEDTPEFDAEETMEEPIALSAPAPQPEVEAAPAPIAAAAPEAPVAPRIKRVEMPPPAEQEPVAETTPVEAAEEPATLTKLETGETIRMTPAGPVVVGADEVEETPAEEVAAKEEEPIEAIAVIEETKPQVVDPAIAKVGDLVPPPPTAITLERPRPEPIIEPQPEISAPVPSGRSKESRKDQTDEALRREIQKLKKKRMRSAASEKSEQQPAPGAGRPAPGRPGGVRPAARRGGAKGTTSDRGRGKRAWRREKRERLERETAAELEREHRAKTVIKVHDATTVADVASALDVSPNELIAKLISMGVMATINQRLDHDAIELIAGEYGFEIEHVDLVDGSLLASLEANDIHDEDLESRPPIVTIMGHVDHGKTKLLDRIRRSDIVASEAGGITQHIGAYQVQVEKGLITFLDTPGHAAFTSMRARGAMVTDLVILVVAADDGVMPQTIEAINHAKAANVPIIVAINKIDREGANLDRVKQELASQNLLVEDWGGQVQCYPISALQGTGVDDLLEGILLQAEMLELKASKKCRARGAIVEARREEGRGTVATVLIQHGILEVGDPFVTGIYSGRVRAMTNDRGHTITKAEPGDPVEITGLQDIPVAGDPFTVVEDDTQARQISIRLQQAQRQRDMKKAHRVTLEQLHTLIEAGELKELRLVVKADVQGSVEAVTDSLLNIESEKVKVVVLHNGVGPISDSDVMLASASNALIVGFNTQAQPSAIALAKSEGVEIRTFNIIYKAIDEIRNAMAGLLDRAYKETIVGRCEIREIFRLSKGLSIAGGQVQDGKVARNLPIRVLRDDAVIHEGKISSLKRFKDDVPEVPSGMECGIGVESFSGLQVADIIECYKLEEVTPTL